MKKRLLALFASVCMLALMLPVGIIPASAETYNGTCGDNLTWSLDTETGVMSIDGEGAMEDYSRTSDAYLTTAPWGTYYSIIKSVIIGDSVTSIGDHAFRYFTSLTSVTIGNSVTSIGFEAFQYCSSLTSVTIPDSVNIIGMSAFARCKSLASVTIGNNVESIGDHAFRECMSLTTITIPDSVTSIVRQAFFCCYKLIEVCNHSSLSISKGDSNYGYVGCYAKHIITDEKDSFLTTTADGYIFYEDGSVSYLMGYVGKETALTLPQASPSGKKYEIYQYAFYNCTSLTKAYYLGSREQWSKVTVGSNNTDLTDHLLFLSDAPTYTTKNGVVTLDSFPGCEYSCDGVNWQASPVFDQLIPGSTYTFTRRLAATKTSPAGTPSAGVKVTLPKATVSAPAAPTIASFTDTTVTLTAVEGCEYKKGSGAWQTSPVFTGLSPATTYTFYQRYAETDTAYASPASIGTTQKTDKSANLSTPAAPTMASRTATSITLKAVSGCEYKLGDGDWQTSTTFTGLSPATEYTFCQRYAETTTKYASASSTGATFKTDKATVSAPAAPTIASFTDTTVTLTAVEGCEYKIGSGAWQTSPVFTGLSPATTYTFYQRYAETDTTYASPASAGTTQKTDKAANLSVPAAPTVASGTETSITLKSVTGCEYKMDDGDWQASPTFTGLTVLTTHTFCQRYAETTTTYASAPSEGVTLIVKYALTAPADPVITEHSNYSVTLKTVTGCEYKMDGGDWQASPIFNDLTPGSRHTFYQRLAETDYTYASPASSLSFTVPKLTVAPPPTPVILTNAGSVVILQAVEGCEYSVDGGAWQTTPAIPGINEGENHVILMRYAETATTEASTISKLFIGTTSYGDSDGNGKLDADDLTVIAKYVAKINTLGTVEYYAADVDNDGDLDADDLTKFSKYIAKIIPDLD